MDDRRGTWATQLAGVVVILMAWGVGFGVMFGGAMGGGPVGSLFAGAGIAIMGGGTLAGLGISFQLNTCAFRLAAAALLLGAVLVLVAVATVQGAGSIGDLLGTALFIALLVLASLWLRRR